MATLGFSILFAPDVDQPVDHYWDGTAPIAIVDTSTPTDTAAFYPTRAAANAALATLITRYPAQHVAVVPSTLTCAFNFPATPEVLAPHAPHA